jgi:hypothetical protein
LAADEMVDSHEVMPRSAAENFVGDDGVVETADPVNFTHDEIAHVDVDNAFRGSRCSPALRDQ